jgi:hypothetical protein
VAATISAYAEPAAGWSVSTATPTTASLTWSAGDVIVTLAGAEDATGGAPTVPTATGLTFTGIDVNANAAMADCRSAYAIAASGGSSTIASSLSIARISGISAWAISGASGIGDHKEQHTTTKSVASTRQGDGSVYVWCCLDFNGDGVGAGTPAPTNTRENLATTSDFLVCDLTNVSTNQSYGEGTGSGGTIGPFSILVVEVLAAAGGTPLLAFKPIPFMT